MSVKSPNCRYCVLYIHVCFIHFVSFFIEGSEVPVPPTIILPLDRTLNEGTPLAEIPCFAEGIPPPEIKWRAVNVR